MRFYNPQGKKNLGRDLVKVIRRFRAKRKFDPKKYIKKKATLVNNYLDKFDLNACIVAVSGGIDSSVTLGILHYASKIKDSPIKKIYPILMPTFVEKVATNQDDALRRGRQMCRFLGLKEIIIDMTENYTLMKQTVDKAMNIVGGAWASGQLVSYIKTPFLYYASSLSTQENFSAIICGATNRDEGAYLGFFGKASDGMVDLQVISDIHKSEVYKVAEFLSLPRNIIKAVPSGDMFDGRTDEEVFGTSYDFVELYLMYLCLKKKEQYGLRLNWSDKTIKNFDLMVSNLESLHNYNKHKYIGDSPSVHLDIYERAVPGGWRKSK